MMIFDRIILYQIVDGKGFFYLCIVCRKKSMQLQKLKLKQENINASSSSGKASKVVWTIRSMSHDRCSLSQCPSKKSIHALRSQGNGQLHNPFKQFLTSKIVFFDPFFFPLRLVCPSSSLYSSSYSSASSSSE